MNNDGSNERLSDKSSQETLQSSDDFGLRDFSFSENYATIVGNGALAPLIKGERIAFETSMPTTSTQYDADEPFQYDFVTSPSHYSDAEGVPLSKTRRPKSYNAFHSSNTTPCTSTRSPRFFFSLSNSVVLSMEMEYTGAKCSNLQTLMNTYKGNSGPGILSLPLAFYHGGLWVGLFGFLIIGAAALNSMHILSKCTEYLEERLDTPVNNYSEAVEVLFEECAPPTLKKFSSFMRHLVNTLILIMQCGVCCIYIVFVATNVKEIVDQLWPGSPSQVSYELIVFMCLTPYLMIRSLKTIAFFSCIANVLFIAGLIIVFQYMLQWSRQFSLLLIFLLITRSVALLLWTSEDIPSYRRLPAFSSFASLPLFFGNAIFSFEGISLVVPLRRKMKEPEAFGGSCGVLTLAMTFHTVLCASMGFYGYLKFGEHVAPTVTLNLPQGNLLYRSVDLMFAIVVFFSTAVQFYVPINGLWPMIEKRLKSHEKLLPGSDRLLVVAQYITRLVLIFAILLVALLVPHVDLLISLVGALMGSTLTMIIPGVLDLILHYFQGKLTVFSVAKDVFIVSIGVCGLVTGTYASLQEIIRTF